MLFADCSHFDQPPTTGSCGFYDGNNNTDLTAALVPAGMRADTVVNDAAYPGSCGRYALMPVSAIEAVQAVIALRSSVANVTTLSLNHDMACRLRSSTASA